MTRFGSHMACCGNSTRSPKTTSSITIKNQDAPEDFFQWHFRMDQVDQGVHRHCGDHPDGLRRGWAESTDEIHDQGDVLVQKLRSRGDRKSMRDAGRHDDV